MYSPKVREDLIPALYRLGRARGRPMTQLVSEAVERYLAAAPEHPDHSIHSAGEPDRNPDTNPHTNPPSVPTGVGGERSQ